METILSIVIPYWNAEKYTNELLDTLNKQIRKEVEVILVDDGSEKPFETRYEWCQVIRKENGGCASARNVGLEKAKGKYIQFIDADDLVPDYFLSRLLKQIKEKHTDVIEFSWKSLSAEGPQHNRKLKDESDRLPNPSVCTRAFKRAFIGDTRFNEKKDSTEDEDFSRKLGYLNHDESYTCSVITEYMYFYRTAIDNSKVKRFKKGLMKTKRIVYYYKHVTRGMTNLLEEIKKEDELNEVWLITEKNDISELKRYCQISPPINIWGHEFRGEPYKKGILITPPFKAQVILYCSYANVIGGIPTFLYNTCQNLKDVIDIAIVYDNLDPLQVKRLSQVVPVIKNDLKKTISCDTIILNRITDKIPENIIYKKSIQVCHACKQKIFQMQKNADYLVNVSQGAKDSWGEQCKDGIVIHNTSWVEDKELLLVSATRMQAADKGSNDSRIRTLANMLNEKKIPFVWLNFSDKGLVNPPPNFINMPPRLNIQSFIKRADYLVQLSDQEAYSMSVLEALCLNTPVIATPFPTLFEEGFIDGKHGYVVPYNMKFDVKKLLNVPKFEFNYDNKAIVEQWKKLFALPGETRGTRLETEAPQTLPSDMVKVKVLRGFTDKYTNKIIGKGDTVMPRQRVEEILKVQRMNKVKLIQVYAQEVGNAEKK